MLDELCEQVHKTAVEKGFWPEDVDDIFITKQLMMIVSEVVEVMEAIRKDEGELRIADEVADILIRTFDLYAGMVEHGYTRASLDASFDYKVAFNKARPERHGVRF